LSHCFYQYNKEVSYNGNKKPVILYVSASNRAVDVFGKYLLSRFSIDTENLSAIRIYSQQIQNNEFPNPSFFNQLKSPAKLMASNSNNNHLKTDNDEECDTNVSEASLREIVLHHVIRKTGKKYANELGKIDKKLSILREFEDRKRNRLCCCGSNLEEFKPYNARLCDHARYYKHSSAILNMPYLLHEIKSPKVKNLETKFIFLKLTLLRIKKTYKETSKLLSNIQSYFQDENLFKSAFPTKLSSLSLEDAEIFLDSLDQEKMETKVISNIKKNAKTNEEIDYEMKKIHSEIESAKNQGVLEENSTYQELMRKHFLKNKNNTIHDLIARCYAKKKREQDEIMHESLTKHLKEAAALSRKDIDEYENCLLQDEKEFFKKELINYSGISIETMREEYNVLLEKACADEIKQHDIILSTCIASRMKAIGEVKIEQLISKYKLFYSK